MPWTNPQAADLVLLTMYAADILEQAEENKQSLSALSKAAIDPRIAKNWNVLGFLYAPDILFKDQDRIGLNEQTVFFGFLARSLSNANELVVALRGTVACAACIKIWVERRPKPAIEHAGRRQLRYAVQTAALGAK